MLLITIFLLVSSCSTEVKKADEPLPDLIFEPAFKAAEAKRLMREKRRAQIDEHVALTSDRINADFEFVFEQYRDELKHLLNRLFNNYAELNGEIAPVVEINEKGHVLTCTIPNEDPNSDFEFHPRICALLKHMYFGFEPDQKEVYTRQLHFKQIDAE